MIELNLRTFCSAVQKGVDNKDVEACTKALFDINVLIELLQSKKAKVIAILEESKMITETEPVHFNQSGLQVNGVYNVTFESMVDNLTSYTLYFAYNNKRFYLSRPKRNLNTFSGGNALAANNYLLHWCGYDSGYNASEIYGVMDLLCGRILNKKVKIEVLEGRDWQGNPKGLNCKFIGSWV